MANYLQASDGGQPKYIRASVRFKEPNSFRKVNCKRVGGERARKNCRKWNKLVARRAKAKRDGNKKLAEQIVREYYGS